jgi:TonB-linked SusC/RagA family outer membrane protein
MRTFYLLKSCLCVMLVLIMVFFVATPSQAQATTDKLISGTVNGPDGNSLPGVTVKLKSNTSRGTVTDVNGKFALRAPANGTLVFSFIGYVAQEVIVGTQTNITVTLQSQDSGLNEVVVIGYGSIARKDVTGSIASVNMTDLLRAPVKSIDDALAGRIAGVQVVAVDGQPGGGNSIKIRGANSITGSNSPLYVVDGFAMEDFDLNSIAPTDVESIDVLKDASATAIYGARGANGVIILTTKRGKSGEPVVTYNGYYGVQHDSKRVEVLSPYEFVKLQLEISPSLYGAEYTTALGRTLDYYKDVKPIDWYGLVFRTGAQQNHNVSINGGTDKTKYSITGSIYTQNGIIINTGYKRFQGRITLDQTLSSKFKVGITVNSSATNTYGEQVNADGGVTAFMPKLWTRRPIQVDPDLDITTELLDPDNVGVAPTTNPFIEAQNKYNVSNGRPFSSNAYLDYSITKDLRLRIGGSVTQATTIADLFNNSLTYHGANFTGSVQGVNGSEVVSRSTTLNNDNTLTYNKKVGNHTFNLLGGFTMQTFKRNSFGATSIYVPNESLGINGLDEGTPSSITSTAGNWGLESFLARGYYNYKSKYNITASIRADGSSKFPPKNRWGYFPSAAVAYRISEEDFIKQLKFVSNAKFRASYGATGNNGVRSEYPYYSSLNFVGNGYSFGNAVPSQGAVANTLGNPDLKWETTRQADVGFDLDLFNGRVTLTADYYNKVTSDLLLTAALPITTGYATATKNVGKVSNSGLEFTLNTVNVSSNKFMWSTNFNISFNKNKVLALTENQEAITTTVSTAQPFYIAKIGRPIAMFYGLQYDGVYQYADFNRSTAGVYTLKDNVPSNTTAALRNNIKPGDIKFVDINGDGIINTNDYTIIGDPNPDFTGGISNNFQYKGFDLNVFFQFSYGNQVNDYNILRFEDGATANINQFAEFANRWTPTNQNTDIPRAGGTVTNFNYSRSIKDGSYLAFKTASLGYTIPKSLLSKVKVKSLRVYVSAQNIFMITNYPGSSPDVSTRDTPLTPGFDYSSYPSSRIFVAGLNVSF